MSIQQNVILEFHDCFDKYIKTVPRSVDSKNKFTDSYSKMSGMIAAIVIKNAIDKVIELNNLPYKTSENNVYIEGCFTEWDLLIVRKGASTLDDLSIYELKDVITVIECKAYGLFFNSKDKLYNPLSKFISAYDSFKNTNPNLRAIYVTISERFPVRESSINYIELTKKVMLENTGLHDSVFCFSTNRKECYMQNGYTWEEFIMNKLL